MPIKANVMKSVLGLFSALFPASAQASDIDLCKSIVIRPIALLYEEADGIPPAETPPHIQRGTVIRRVTQYVVDRKTGLTGFCAHFDTCYRATATVNGRQVKAQRLLNCTIDFSHPDRSADEIIYGLAPDPRKNSVRDMRIYRAFDRLLSLGIESESLALASVDAPRSRCGRIAGSALAGDKRARAALRKAAHPRFGMTPEKAAEQVEKHSEHPDYLGCI